MGTGSIRRIDGDSKKTTLHIKGIDDLAEKEDVLEALVGIVGSLEGKNVNIGEFRPNARNTKAISVTINSEDTNKILASKLRIGITPCNVQKRAIVDKCFKCWEPGHHPSACTGPDRLRLCHRCAQAGHVAKDCNEEDFCAICDKKGHQVGSGKCEIFRKALTQARRIERQN